LCWVHVERLVHRLDTFTDLHRAAQQKVRQLTWDFYADLKLYQANPGKRRRPALRARFDRIVRRRTGFVTLDRLLARLHADKAALLMVLDRPETPLNTNGSANDIRCHVTRRKVSACTRSDPGRDGRDAFAGLTRPAPGTPSRSGMILATGSTCPVTSSFRHCQSLVRCRGQPA